MGFQNRVRFRENFERNLTLNVRSSYGRNFESSLRAFFKLLKCDLYIKRCRNKYKKKGLKIRGKEIKIKMILLNFGIEFWMLESSLMPWASRASLAWILAWFPLLNDPRWLLKVWLEYDKKKNDFRCCNLRKLKVDLWCFVVDFCLRFERIKREIFKGNGGSL